MPITIVNRNKAKEQLPIIPLAILSIAQIEKKILKPDLLLTNKRAFILKKGLQCKIEEKTDFWIASNDDLGMEIFEPTKAEVEREFAEAFNELYEIYVLESDSKLSEKAKELKEKIKSYINLVYER